jgi:hypothetical protein
LNSTTTAEAESIVVVCAAGASVAPDVRCRLLAA